MRATRRRSLAMCAEAKPSLVALSKVLQSVIPSSCVVDHDFRSWGRWLLALIVQSLATSISYTTLCTSGVVSLFALFGGEYVGGGASTPLTINALPPYP